MRNRNTARTLAAEPVGPRTAEHDAWLRELDRGLAEFRDFIAEIATSTRVSDIAEELMPFMTHYLAGELPPEAAAEVTHALRTEPLMRKAFGSVVAAWQAPSGEREVTAAEVDAAYERFKALRARKAPGLPPTPEGS
ncbi:MAG TPA: hypothetical protein VF178_03965 [Gemmatimonadaceae bacterium]